MSPSAFLAPSHALLRDQFRLFDRCFGRSRFSWRGLAGANVLLIIVSVNILSALYTTTLLHLHFTQFNSTGRMDGYLVLNDVEV